MGPSSVLFLLFIIASFSTFEAKKFPDSFKFGAGISAFQAEGAWNEDGKGPSIWDTFTHIPGNVDNNETSDISCDTYHKYKDDVQILKSLNLTLYRFSVAWTRIMTDGTPSSINQRGINYYINLISELRSNDIEPLITLYHWDLPQHLSDLGGWLNPQIADYFGDYARVVYKFLGPYVKYWVTINEPGVMCLSGYGMGQMAPGLSLIGDGDYQCAYNVLRAHAKAYRIYDEEFKAEQGGQVAINAPITAYYPKDFTNSLDVVASDRLFDFTVGIFMDPIYVGNWPQIVIDRIANRSQLEKFPLSRLPKFTQEEIDYINGTHDYFTLNVYTSSLVEYMEDFEIGEPTFWADVGVLPSTNPNWVSNEYGLASDPTGVRQVLNSVNKRYNPGEIIVTENGWADSGELEDEGRISYLKGYLSNILDAIMEDGINVTAYTVWSFLDNFEWKGGYSVKYGIVKVDFDSPNRTRTIKSSGKWYQELATTREIKTNHSSKPTLHTVFFIFFLKVSYELFSFYCKY